MASKPESLFVDRVNNWLPIEKRKGSLGACRRCKGPLIHYEKMNNPFRSGTADGWYSGPGGDVWVEFKYLPSIPIRTTVKPLALLSTLQNQWLTGRHEQGRNVAVIIGCPAGGVVLTALQWHQELSSLQFGARLMSESELAAWVQAQVS